MLHSVILDGFLPDFAGWRAWADTCEFKDEVNPADGVTYPAICRNVPTYGMHKRLSAIMGRPISLTATFMRLSVGGAPCPHFAHTDEVMGEWSCMVYLNRPEHCQGGTALIEHVSGTDPDHETWARDTNDESKWRVKSLCEMVSNRAFVFRSKLWHAALPKGGFGSSATDGRLVLTCFYS